MFVALRVFSGVVDGVTKTFYMGDRITDGEAKEMGLAEKPHLAEKVKREAKKTRTSDS